MSMIYDALRGAGDPPATAAATPTRISVPRYGLWLALGVALVSGPLGFVFARGTAHINGELPRPAISPAERLRSVSSPVEDPKISLSANHEGQGAPPTVNAANLVPIVLATRSSVQNLGLAKPTERSLIPIEHSTNPTGLTTVGATTTAMQLQNNAAPLPKISVSQLPSQPSASTQKLSPGDEPDAMAVRAAMAQLQTAVADSNTEGRDRALAELQKLLPGDSLTLLRARAWAAHGTGDINLADQYYRAILQRVPDDENAGVNIALIDAGRGDIEKSRERLNRMASRDSRSTMVSRALTELERSQQ